MIISEIWLIQIAKKRLLFNDSISQNLTDSDLESRALFRGISQIINNFYICSVCSTEILSFENQFYVINKIYSNKLFD